MKLLNKLSYLGCTLGIALAFALSAACSSALFTPVYPKFAPEKRVAIVSFSLDNKIPLEGGFQDEGAGLLNDKAVYYAGHQAAVDAMWKLFVEDLELTFHDVNLMPVDEVLAHSGYQAKTQHVPKMVLGKDIAPGFSQITPTAGINFVASTPEDCDKVAETLEVDVVLLVRNSGNLVRRDIVDRPKLGNRPAASAELRTELIMCERGKGITFSRNYHTPQSAAYAPIREEYALVKISEEYVDPSDFPELFTSALKPLLAEMALDVQKGQQQSAEANAAAPAAAPTEDQD